MKMLKLLALVAVALFLTACGGVQVKTLDQGTAAHLQGKSIVLVTYGRPPFAAMTAGKAGFGMLGAAAMFQSGRTLSIKHDIKDPAVKIRRNLAEALKQKYSMRISGFSTSPPADRSMSTIIGKYGKAADFILDVNTREMGYLYYPTRWGRYQVRYLGTMRLIDARTSKVIASANCNSLQGDHKNPPTRVQLLADNAALLKTYLERTVGACTKLLSSKVLGIQ